jgi:hypothetical protein
VSPARDYSAELEALAANLSAADSAEASRVGQTHRADLQHLTHAYLCLRYLIERGDLNASAPEGIRILYGMLTEGVGAILQLLKAGLPGPAAQVFRSALEASIHLQVILRDADATSERASLFEDFRAVKRFDGRFGEGVTEKQRMDAEKHFEAIKANYHPTHHHSWAWKVCPSKRTHRGIPDNPNLKDLCTFIRHPEYHEQLYGRLSYATHPSPLYEIWLRREDRNMYVGPKISILAPGVARLTAGFSMDALLRMLECLKPSDAHDLRIFFANVLLSGGPVREGEKTP